jgi:hypothetical protein
LTLDLSGLPPALRALLQLALQARSQPPELVNESFVLPHKLRGWTLSHLGWADLRQTIGLIGELLLAVGRLRQRPGVFRATDLLHHMEQMGPRSLPIVSHSPRFWWV